MESKIKNGWIETPYPKLLANADRSLVVLFSQARVGTVVYFLETGKNDKEATT